MKAANAEDIRALALVHGAEATIEGRTFNAGGHVHSAPRAAPSTPVPAPAPAIPAPEADPDITFEQVQRLISDQVNAAVRAAEGRMKRDLTEITNSLTIAFAAALRETKATPGREILKWRMPVEYGGIGEIKVIELIPVYKD